MSPLLPSRGHGRKPAAALSDIIQCFPAEDSLRVSNPARLQVDSVQHPGYRQYSACIQGKIFLNAVSSPVTQRSYLICHQIVLLVSVAAKLIVLTHMQAKTISTAVGRRAINLPIPSAEHAIISDDILDLAELPKKLAIVSGYSPHTACAHAAGQPPTALS